MITCKPQTRIVQELYPVRDCLHLLAVLSVLIVRLNYALIGRHCEIFSMQCRLQPVVVYIIQTSGLLVYIERLRGLAVQ